MDGAELVERWGDQLSPEFVQRAEKLGLVRPLGDGRYEVTSPRLQQASEEIARLGVPLETALDVIATVKRHAAAVSSQYVRLFLEHVWEPFEQAGEPEEQWGEIRETLDRLRPLATESLVAVFQIVMTREVERTLERELVQRRPRRGAPGRQLPRSLPCRHAAARRGADTKGEEPWLTSPGRC